MKSALRFARPTLFAALLLFAAVLWCRLDADEGDKPRCPLCEAEVTFENSPEGAFKKWRMAVLLEDLELFKECVACDDDKMEGLFRKMTPKGPEGLLGFTVASVERDGEKARLTIKDSAGKEDALDAVQVEGTWRLDFQTRQQPPDEGRARAMLRQLQAACTAYHADYGVYPLSKNDPLRDATWNTKNLVIELETNPEKSARGIPYYDFKESDIDLTTGNIVSPDGHPVFYRENESIRPKLYVPEMMKPMTVDLWTRGAGATSDAPDDPHVLGNWE